MTAWKILLMNHYRNIYRTLIKMQQVEAAMKNFPYATQTPTLFC